MSIKGKLVLVTLIILLGQIGFLFSNYYTKILPTITKSEQHLAENQNFLAISYINQQRENLSNTALLLTQHKFFHPKLIQDASQSSLLTDLGLSFIYLLDNNDQLIWSQTLNHINDAPYPSLVLLQELKNKIPTIFDKNNNLYSLPKHNGVLNSSMGSLVIAKALIIDDQKQTNYKILIGKALDLKTLPTSITLKTFNQNRILSKQQATLTKLIKTTNLTPITELNKDTVDIYSIYPDINQEPILLTNSTALNLTKLIEKSVKLFVYTLIASFCLILAMNLWLVHKYLVKPLKRLTYKITQARMKNLFETTSLVQENYNNKNNTEFITFIDTLNQALTEHNALVAQKNSKAYKTGIKNARDEIVTSTSNHINDLLLLTQSIQAAAQSLPNYQLDAIIAEAKNSSNLADYLQNNFTKLAQINELLYNNRSDIKNILEKIETKLIRLNSFLKTESYKNNSIKQTKYPASEQ